MTDPTRAALEALLTLTACDVCQSSFVGVAWCHEQMTTTILRREFVVARAALATPAPEPERCAHEWGIPSITPYRCAKCFVCYCKPAPAAPPTSAEALRDALVNEMHASDRGTLEWIADDEAVHGLWHDLVFRLDAIIAAARQPWTVEPEAVARMFHETYERLASDFGYETRRESAVPWEQVPDNNRRLMVAVAAAILAALEAQR